MNPNKNIREVLKFNTMLNISFRSGLGSLFFVLRYIIKYNIIEYIIEKNTKKKVKSSINCILFFKLVNNIKPTMKNTIWLKVEKNGVTLKSSFNLKYSCCSDKDLYLFFLSSVSLVDIVMCLVDKVTYLADI